MNSSVLPQTWNLFRRRDEGELWCAVPADTAIPPFLFSGAWDYSGQHPEMQTSSGFKNRVARQSVRMNGFYLFQRIAGPLAERSTF